MISFCVWEHVPDYVWSLKGNISSLQAEMGSIENHSQTDLLLCLFDIFLLAVWNINYVKDRPESICCKYLCP